ncbi:lyso-ornithine lipid acyltransferase [Nitrosospira multiformis]|uniref:Lyso-ornithine lipid acyltransferase n=1 Tax=Nitrosospira multiformis TaxID=1231 RepID=A0A1H8M7K0_9PROT|nr:lysophospholipid acyltransferase family protein [Nitrosospira multiformis]SEO13323.1 lyso-ornithine lipid acyltransferase [Nitrosospira multiformis]
MPNVTTSLTASRLTRAVRWTRLLLHIASGLIQSAIYPHVGQRTQRRMAQKWSARLLSILGVRVRHQGILPVAGTQRVMLAANHVSWLDVYSIISVCPARFVAKSEIRGWPLFGWLSNNVGTLFIERTKRRDTARINDHIAEALNNGDCVAIFPEGGTSDGTVLHHFHASLLQPAVSVSAMLHPVAIRYTDMAGNISKAAAYFRISLLESVRQVLSQPHIDVELVFTEAIDSHGKNRRELARSAEHAIASALSLPLPHKPSGKPSDPPDEQP